MLFSLLNDFERAGGRGDAVRAIKYDGRANLMPRTKYGKHLAAKVDSHPCGACGNTSIIPDIAAKPHGMADIQDAVDGLYLTIR